MLVTISHRKVRDSNRKQALLSIHKKPSDSNLRFYNSLPAYFRASACFHFTSLNNAMGAILQSQLGPVLESLSLPRCQVCYESSWTAGPMGQLRDVEMCNIGYMLIKTDLGLSVCVSVSLSLCSLWSGGSTVHGTIPSLQLQFPEVMSERCWKNIRKTG